MIIVNMFGQPGAGKSTNASRLFTMLKDLDVNCELVSEFAKDLVWEERFKTLSDQIYVFGKQYHKISRLKDKVDVVITDSPLILCMYYDKNREFSNLKPLISEVHNSFDSINVFLNRVKKYNPIGRYQNEEESDIVAVELKALLSEEEIDFIEASGSKEGCEIILKEILSKIRR